MSTERRAPRRRRRRRAAWRFDRARRVGYVHEPQPHLAYGYRSGREENLLTFEWTT